MNSSVRSGAELCSSENMLLYTSWKVSKPSASRELNLWVGYLVVVVVDLRYHTSTEHDMAARYSFQYKLNLPLEIHI